MIPLNNKANLPMTKALNAINAKKPRTNGRRAAAFNLNNNNNGNKSFFVFLPFPRAANSDPSSVRKRNKQEHRQWERGEENKEKRQKSKAVKITFRLEYSTVFLLIIFVESI